MGIRFIHQGFFVARPWPKRMAPATPKVGSAAAIRARRTAAPWWCPGGDSEGRHGQRPPFYG